jgi:hypothetical protein
MPTEHKLGIGVQTPQANSLAAEGRKAGMSRSMGWFQRILVGIVPQRGHPGKFALVEKFMKRVGFGDWYSEKVRDQETGELIHQCEEPLSEHQRHGSDRSGPPKEPPQSN